MIVRGRKRRSSLESLVGLQREVFASFKAVARGEEILFNVFWGHLMIGIALIHLATLLSENALQITRPVLLPLSFLWISWAVVGVWRCASNVTKKYWGQLARFLSLIFSVSPFWLLP